MCAIAHVTRRKTLKVLYNTSKKHKAATETKIWARNSKSNCVAAHVENGRELKTKTLGQENPNNTCVVARVKKSTENGRENFQNEILGKKNIYIYVC